MPETETQRIAQIGRVRQIEVRFVEPLMLDGRNRSGSAGLGWYLKVVAV